MIAIVFYLSYNKFNKGELTTENFSTIIIAVIPLGTQINDIIWYVPDLAKSISTLSYYNNWVKEIYTYSMSATIPPPSSCVYDLSGVSFSYEDQDPLLTNYSITLPTGLVWLRGESGAGKSTFTKLLLGTLLPQYGTIRLGDTIVTPSIRQHVMYLHQHAASLFSTTIYSNIMYGIEENEQYHTKLHQLIDKYHLYSLFGCKEGDDSFLHLHVGTLGEHLSGGQRQMIHLLRCLILDRTLYIMD
jgi:ABC-type bacteriocin/lantibiotic exporter with double-glycine peptidase domain